MPFFVYVPFFFIQITIQYHSDNSQPSSILIADFLVIIITILFHFYSPPYYAHLANDVSTAADGRRLQRHCKIRIGVLSQRNGILV